MTDEQLKEYLPSYGDRLAVLGYCRRKGNNPAGRKSKLFERLRAKISKKQNDNRDHLSEKEPLKNAQKNVRKVEIGWMHFHDGKFLQVRTKKGGGTRKISVSKDCKKDELIERALDLFFPNKKNAKGRISDFVVDITDFQEHSFDDQTTVGELYEQTKLPLLRFYLTTKQKNNRSGSLPENSVEAIEQEGENMEHTTSNWTSPSTPRTSPRAPLTEPGETSDVDLIYVGSSNNLSNINSSNVSVVYTTVDMTELSGVQELDAAIGVDVLEDSGTVTFITEPGSGMEDYSLDDTLPLSQQSSRHVLSLSLTNIEQEHTIHTESLKRILVVHRGQILKELISHFCDESIMLLDISIQVILPDGRLEKAVDEGGVLRDVLSEFWQDFYEQCTLGNDFKVPYLRHDFGQNQWESIGRIIAFGWQKEKYLPVKIAPVILEQAAIGCVKSCLVDSFLRYVTESDRKIFDLCRTDFESVDQEELIELLDLHSCRRVVNADNVEQLLEELAHQKLIQEPAFVIERWSNVLMPIRSELEDITAAYECLQPTSRKIMRSIIFPTTMNDQQKQIGKYLNTYLRESDTQHLSLFLRFCTGSDMFLGKSIGVSFTQLQGFQRRPVAHTCGCYLEMAVNYDN